MLSPREVLRGPDPLAEDLIRALAALAREDAQYEVSAILPLVDHPAPEVRAEALSALLVTGRMEEHRALAIRALSRDGDEGVRARAAYAIAATAEESTVSTDLNLLLRALRNTNEASDVRRASYEAIQLMFHRTDFPDALEDFEPDVDVDWSWIEELELLYG